MPAQQTGKSEQQKLLNFESVLSSRLIHIAVMQDFLLAGNLLSVSTAQ